MLITHGANGNVGYNNILVVPSPVYLIKTNYRYCAKKLSQH
jgi:hypothetical protein